LQGWRRAQGEAKQGVRIIADQSILPQADHVPESPRVLAEQEVRLVSALVLLLGLGLFLALPFVLSIGAVVFLPFVAGIFLSILLAPLAGRLIRWRIPAMLAALLSIIVFFTVLVLVLGLILQPALDTFDRAPQMLAKISAELTQLRGNLDWLNDLNRQLARLSGRSPSREVVIAAPSVIEQVAFATPTVLLELLLSLLVTFFMLTAVTRPHHSALLERASRNTTRRASQILRAVQGRVGTYIVTVTLINTGIGVIVALGAWLFGLEAPIMWGGLAAVLNFLPYVGPLVMIAALALFGLGTQDSALVGIIPALAFMGLHAVESNVVTPAVLGARFTMNPVLILFSISYFTWIWGVAGALLSIPILLTLKALFEHIGTPNLVGFVFGEPLFALPEHEDEA
jgi:predicted PurR-regulated permease PerM